MYTDGTSFETSRLNLPQCLKIEYKHTPLPPQNPQRPKDIFNYLFCSLYITFAVL